MGSQEVEHFKVHSVLRFLWRFLRGCVVIQFTEDFLKCSCLGYSHLTLSTAVLEHAKHRQIVDSSLF